MVIKEKATESKAWWSPTVGPPNGAPNVLLIITDDVGFGAPSTFGGIIPTPVVIVTANNEPGTAEQTRALGAAAFLTKPVEKAALLHAIESAISSHRSR